MPVTVHPAAGHDPGTRVTLYHIKQAINQEMLERKLCRQLPLNQPKFVVYLNGRQLKPHYIPGRRFRIHQPSEYGSITGEIVVSSLQLASEFQDIAIRVKGVEVCREYFSLDQSRAVAKSRLTGEINADWLPLTAARDQLLKDTHEYLAFIQALAKPIKRIRQQLARLKQHRQDIQADQALSDALIEK